MASLPPYLTVAGRRVPLVSADLGEYGAVATFDPGDLQISVDPSWLAGASDSEIRSTLRHEVFHAFLHLAGLAAALPDGIEEVFATSAEHLLFPALDAVPATFRVDGPA